MNNLSDKSMIDLEKIISKNQNGLSNENEKENSFIDKNDKEQIIDKNLNLLNINKNDSKSDTSQIIIERDKKIEINGNSVPH